MRDLGTNALQVAALVAAGAAAAEGAVERKIDVLLAVHTHHEGRHVHNLFAHPAAVGENSMSAQKQHILLLWPSETN